jgi:hypothetical protein
MANGESFGLGLGNMPGARCAECGRELDRFESVGGISGRDGEFCLPCFMRLIAE